MTGILGNRGNKTEKRLGTRGLRRNNAQALYKEGTPNGALGVPLPNRIFHIRAADAHANPVVTGSHCRCEQKQGTRE